MAVMPAGTRLPAQRSLNLFQVLCSADRDVPNVSILEQCCAGQKTAEQAGVKGSAQLVDIASR